LGLSSIVGDRGIDRKRMVDREDMSWRCEMYDERTGKLLRQAHGWVSRILTERQLQRLWFLDFQFVFLVPKFVFEDKQHEARDSWRADWRNMRCQIWESRV
jgi:hypothetical protein